MYQIYLKGQEAGQEYLTEEIAQKILRKSESARDYIMSLPFASGRKEDGVDMVIGELLSNSGIKPSFFEDGHCEVSMNDFFNFLRQTTFPPVMLDALRLSPDDDLNNYGISRVMRENSGGREDTYFKIGLVQQGEEMTNSYVMMIGEDIRLLGYSKGENFTHVHQQMLNVGATLANFALKS